MDEQATHDLFITERNASQLRYLWIISAAMVMGGVALTAAGLLSLTSPIAVAAGILLTWSGIIKVIILRIWRVTLPPLASSPRSATFEPLNPRKQ